MEDQHILTLGNSRNLTLFLYFQHHLPIFTPPKTDIWYLFLFLLLFSTPFSFFISSPLVSNLLFPRLLCTSFPMKGYKILGR